MEGIVVGVDGSGASFRALTWAVHEGARRGLPVHAVAAWSEPLLPTRTDALVLLEPPEAYERMAKELARDMVDEVVGDCGPDVRVDVTGSAQQGAAGRVLVRLGEDADLLVVGRTGAGAHGRPLPGSTAVHCLHHAGAPVAVVPDGVGVPSVERVVAGLDGSERSREALRWAAAEARGRAVPLLVVRAWLVPSRATDRPDEDVPMSMGAWSARALREAASWVEDALGSAADEVRAPHGEAVDALLGEVLPTDLLVVGARGLGPVLDRLLGSVSRACVERAPCPVVVVRLREDAATQRAARQDLP